MEVTRVPGVPAESPPTAAAGQKPKASEGSFSGQLTAAIPEAGDSKSLHTVKRGETLSDISLRYLRESGAKVNRQSLYEAVQKVAQANNLADADLILPGQTLDMSALSGKAAPTSAVAALESKEAVPKLALPDTKQSLPPVPVPDTRKFVPEVSAPKRIAEVRPTTKELIQPLTERPNPIRAELPTRPEPGPKPGLGGPHLAVAMAPMSDPVADALPAGPWERILGSAGALTSRFGSRKDPFTGGPDFHKGIDIAAPKGTAIRAAQAGRVIFSGWQPGYGNVVIVRHQDGLETVYGHSHRNLVKVGQEIEAGTKVAEVGSSGRSTGPHLHFEVRKNGRPVDPLPLLKQQSLQVAEIF